ncbi:hypothetical protein NMY22_g15276 [Coprinellus aureogranulatus]|nr:hypothetical protein NMY22_g15276 [Coprinellus aureogranulatus]
MECLSAVAPTAIPKELGGFGVSTAMSLNWFKTIMLSEKRLSLPRRHQLMPTLYEVENHPLLEGREHVRKVYVGHMGTDKRSVKDYSDFEKTLKCPEGDVGDWERQGLLQMEAGDYLFLRDPAISDDAKDDVLAVMVTGSGHHSKDVLDALENATQAMLGERNQRSLDSTAFERTHCARKIQKKRCYSVGLAVQLSRRVVAPSASLAQDEANIQQYQHMVKDLVDSTSAMLLKVQDALPEGCLKAFAANAELTGQPGVGRKTEYATNSIQVNISAAGLSALDTRLVNQLGDFGSEHYDGRDSPDHFTTMFSNPDIPAYYKPGAFHILQLGVFVVLDKYVGVTFSGQRRHVGTAPTPPLGAPSEESAYRFNVVCYPKDGAVDGLSRFTLASLPGKKARKARKRRRKKDGNVSNSKGKAATEGK